MLITSGFWYGRNIVEALNPFPQIEKLGPINLPGPDQLDLYPREPHELSEYYNDPTVWDAKLFPVLENRLGPLWPVILAVVVVGLVFALLRGGSALMRILAVTGIVAGIAYIFTLLTASVLGDPTGFDANLRYVAPVLIVGFLLLPLVPWIRHGNRPWILIGLFTVLLIQGTVTRRTGSSSTTRLGRARLPDRGGAGADRHCAAPRGEPSRRDRARAGGGDHGGRARPRARGLLPRSALRHRDAAPLIGGFRSTPEWQPLQDWGRETADKRIGVVGRAGAFGQYFFYGNDLSNHVQYVGTPLRRGTFRPIANCRSWRRAVNEGDYDFIVTTPKLGQLEITAPPENLWTEQDENVKVIIKSGPRRSTRWRARSIPAPAPSSVTRRSHELRGLPGGLDRADRGRGRDRLCGRRAARQAPPGWSGASARLAEVVLGLSLLVVILELVGVVGLYRPGWVLAATLIVGIGLGAGLRAHERPRPSGPRSLRSPSRWRSPRRCWWSPTGRCPPRSGSTSACTCRTPPGTTPRSPRGSYRRARWARFTSPRYSI